MTEIKYCDCHEDELKNYLNLPGEKLIIVKRQHWLVIIGPIILASFVSLAIAILVLMVGLLTHSIIYPIFTIVLIALSYLSLICKIMIDWYYHLYIVTNRKILEIRIVPVFADEINDVLLDQVRTTEVDAKINTFVSELFSMGSVVITFDRPSKDQVFVLEDISHPREVGIYLADALETIMQPTPVWFQKEEVTDYVKYAEDIFPHHNSNG